MAFLLEKNAGVGEGSIGNINACRTTISNFNLDLPQNRFIKFK